MGVAIGQELPPETGLTPGAPLASDPYSGEGVTVGETRPGEQAFVGPAPAPVTVEPLPAEPMLAEPMPAEPVGIAQPVVPAGPPAALAYPEELSPVGLTPGAPLGSDAISDQKTVVGDHRRGTGAGILFR